MNKHEHKPERGCKLRPHEIPSKGSKFNKHMIPCKYCDTHETPVCNCGKEFGHHYEDHN